MKKENKKVRVRFAPSPTGSFHIGSARTALINYLYAKKNKGVFVLRIEDTDKQRSEKKYEEDIMRSLNWLNISWDEGPIEDEESEKGDFKPYRQSKRKSIYEKYTTKLLNSNKAYYCFCSKEESEDDSKSCECLSLPEKQREELITAKHHYVVRLNIPEEETVKFKDMIRGNIAFETKELGGDFVITKEDFSPLYNFACVVDDYEMKITHVIRGEDHISNTPKQILIQKALGITTPEYAHLPLILGPDRSKLSKRHATVSVYKYREMGYLPEAIVNFIVFLGWNPGDDREIYSLEEIIENFTISRCRKSGAIFDIKKLQFLNSQYIKQKSDEEFAEMCIPHLIGAGSIKAEFKEEQYPPAYGGMQAKTRYLIPSRGESISLKKIAEIVSLYKEKIKILSEISDQADYFFKDKPNYEKEILIWKEMTDEEIKKSLDKSIKVVSNLEEEKEEDFKKALMEEAEKEGDRGAILWPFRAAITGKRASAGPFEVAAVLGRKEVLKRLQEAKNKLSS